MHFDTTHDLDITFPVAFNALRVVITRRYGFSWDVTKYPYVIIEYHLIKGITKGNRRKNIDFERKSNVISDQHFSLV